MKVHFHNFRVTEIYETSEASVLINTNMKECCFTRRSFNLNFQKKKPLHNAFGAFTTVSVTMVGNTSSVREG